MSPSRQGINILVHVYLDNKCVVSHEMLVASKMFKHAKDKLFVELLGCPRSLDEELKNLGSVRG